MNPLIRVLYLEDEPADLELVRAMLEEAGLSIRITRVETRDEFGEALRQDKYDIILADYRLPMYDGMAALQLVRELCPDVPFIFVSGTMGEEAAIEGLTKGATDYVLKQNLSRLGPAVTRALHEAENLRERKRAEEELHRLSRAVEQSASIIVVTDTEGYIEYANPRFTEITGYSLAEARGQHTRILKSGHTPLEEYQRLWERITAGKEWRGEFLNKKKNGELYWESASISPIKDTGGAITHFLAVKEDITERKRAERALEESEAKMRSILENIEIGVALISPKMEILEMNGRMRKWFGAVDPSRFPICYHVFKDPPSEEVCDYCPTCKTLQDGLVHEAMIEAQRANIDRKYRIVSSPVINGPGEITAAIEMVEDITEKLAMESQLRQAQKMEAIGTLAGGIAHDFNNILGAIIGISELELLEVEKGSSLYQHIGQVLKACERARDLTKQILAFSRHREEQVILLSMKPIVKEALKLLRSSLPSTIAIRHHVETEPGLVKGDPTQIHQVLMNLCTNAEHAMREKGGTLEVRLRKVELPLESDELTTKPDLRRGPYVCLSVSDTGYGIPPEAIDRIFDPYFTTKEVGDGTGLGLAVVQGIVRKSGGAITVKSEPGRGTTFHVYFPSVEGGKQEFRVADSVSLPTGNERILFVDDEEALANVGKGILEGLGYEVSARTSSREAFELFKAKPEYFDLVITDMNMPNMTGEQLSRELMKIRPDMPIILCTGFSHVMTEEDAREMGIRAFVMKPVLRTDLAQTVRRVLDVKNPEKSP